MNLTCPETQTESFKVLIHLYLQIKESPFNTIGLTLKNPYLSVASVIFADFDSPQKTTKFTESRSTPKKPKEDEELKYVLK